MSSIEETFKTLRELQEILSEKIELEKEIESVPKMFTAQNELIVRLKKSFIETNQDYETAKTAETEFREMLILAEAAREEAEKKMDVINTQREYEALDREIRDAAEREAQYRKDLQQEERRITGLDEQMKQSEAFIEQQEAELNERRSQAEAEMVEKKKRVDDLQRQQEERTESMDKEFLFKFDRIIRNKKGRGIVSVRGGVCTGCHMILPAQFANDVHEGKEIVFCPYCSRILYHEDMSEDEEVRFDTESVGSLADLDDLDEEKDDEEEDEEEGGVNFED
ncbi:MAG: C4-type zinc ribbon domain-containing protein [Spirochaetaceae bacterium]|jgi:predicted  nucleic acid-binding Zn-ribbon protein|nr:C4-type zinc ribbon domain-containing protein [Spirochaetaceae bacterium]